MASSVGLGRMRGLASSLSSLSNLTRTTTTLSRFSISSIRSTASLPSSSSISSLHQTLARHYYSSPYHTPPYAGSYTYGPTPDRPQMHATTILTVRRGSHVCVIGDGQVSLGSTVVKPNARKVRIIGNGKVICGFAGSTADCFTLLDKLEKKLEEYPGQLLRAAVEMAKEWRTDKFLRHLEAWMIAVDKDISVTITGNGDVISAPEDGVVGIGSGGLYAVSAARALVGVPNLPLNAREIAERAMNIAGDVCVYTNKNFVIEEIKDGQILKLDDSTKSQTTAQTLSAPDTTSTPTPPPPTESS